ncbi:PREDICTED: protein trichome birefringence-like 19 [Ipomoea nil]|uniref:protein trichome birefringence-like 19 n=1 Tax=Ipomoea nil TaxID=35883 RepID=UPI000900ACD9|nr:PREDICTED: protein trichome birefringence-like 19 [Ipomoea nil]
MKSQGNDHVAGGKPQTRRRVGPKVIPFVAVLVLFTFVSISYPSIRYSQTILSRLSSDDGDDPILPPAEEQPCPVEGVVTQPCRSSGGESQAPPEAAEAGEAAEDSVFDVNSDHEDRRENISSTIVDINLVTAAVEEAKVQVPPKSNLENPATSNSGEVNLLAAEEKVKVAPRKKSSRRRRRSRRRKRRDSAVTAPRIVSKTEAPKKEGKVPAARSDGGGDDDDVKVLASEVAYNNEGCNLFSGEWVQNPEGPYYTNMTCNWAIQEHQNCMKFGRPDTEFLKWRWKPEGCELPIFDPEQFLEMVRGKSLAFVGDSVARNHMQSLLCVLSRVAQPVDASNSPDQNFKRWEYRDYDFNISKFWSPYLVRTEKMDPNDDKRPFKLFLDEFDESWTTQIESFDYVIISAGHWFFRPTYFYLNGEVVGCQYCPESDIKHLPSYFSYRRAFHTAFRAINSLESFNGVVFLRSFAPSHFENGPWDKGGDCARTKPLKRIEKDLDDYNLEFYKIQLQELKTAQTEGRRKGMKLRLFDATLPMLLRADGHPSKFGRWPNPNATAPNDCVHWCLPGPIDSWNDFLVELMKREGRDRKSEI